RRRVLDSARLRLALRFGLFLFGRRQIGGLVSRRGALAVRRGGGRAPMGLPAGPGGPSVFGAGGLRGARAPLPGQLLALARQLFLLVEAEYVERVHVEIVETSASAQDRRNGEQGDQQNNALSAAHGRSSALAVGGDQGRQDIGASAGAGRRFAITC